LRPCRGSTVILALLSAAVAAAQFRASVSVSPFTESLLSRGIAYTDGTLTASTLADLQRLFVKYGATEVYARIATAPHATQGPADHSLARGLDRARVAAALGLPFNPELGLFDVYGDVRCQPPPDAALDPHWTSLRLDQMVPLLRAYTAKTAREILSTGVKVNVWDLGNEVEFGVAGVAVRPMPGACDDTSGPNWYRPPEQIDPEIGKTSVEALMRLSGPKRIAWLTAHLWPSEAKLLAAAADGIRSIDPKARFSTHISGLSATRSAQAVAFFHAMRAGGYSPDELGLSYYPSSTGDPLAAFQQTVTELRTRLDRPVFIAEFAYPSRPMEAGPFKSWSRALPGYPLTPGGQAAILRAIVDWGRTHGVSGIRPWAPDLAAPGWSPMSFFTNRGKSAVAGPALTQRSFTDLRQ
jgi:arabinogalactan endo-1,4-beta-galactosidase